VALLTLLLLPIGPAVLIYEQISNQLAAESIARHAVRAAMLDAPLGGFNDPGTAISVLARSWQKQVSGYRVTSQGQLITLEVQVGGASALATLGREPTR
jgi:zona occludens toxin (predicted ATPase)